MVLIESEYPAVGILAIEVWKADLYDYRGNKETSSGNQMQVFYINSPYSDQWFQKYLLEQMSTPEGIKQIYIPLQILTFQDSETAKHRQSLNICRL